MRVRIEGDVRLFVETEGDWIRDQPTIVALHGGPGVDHVFLRGAFGPVAEHARIVMYDHRGMGRSDHRTCDEWNLATWADDVVRLCDALGIERPVVHGGSFGGQVAVAYAARHPDHASGIILDGPCARFVHSRVVEGFRRAGGDEAAAAASKFWADPGHEDIGEYMKACLGSFVHKPSRKPQAREDYAAISAPSAEGIAVHWVGGEWQTYDVRDGLRKLACPALIFGGAYDPIVPIESVREVAECIPDVRLHEFPDAGHGCMGHEPERTHELIIEFLRELSG